MSAVHERAVAPGGNTGKSRFNRDRQKAIVGIEENNVTSHGTAKAGVAGCREAPIVLLDELYRREVDNDGRRIIS